MNRPNGIVVAIDGPAGSGKSTTAREAARRLGYTYLDTGAMYRAVALAVLTSKGDPDDADAAAAVAARARIELQPAPEGQRTLLDAKDVSDQIRTPDVSDAASRVAAHPGVREVLVRRQQEMGRLGGIVAEGRDTGTVVYPDAELKVFMIADVASRAQRRAAELEKKGESVDQAALIAMLEERDARDEATQQRTGGWEADDAVGVDTTGLTIDGQVAKVVELAVARGARLPDSGE